MSQAKITWEGQCALNRQPWPLLRPAQTEENTVYSYSYCLRIAGGYLLSKGPVCWT